tara:strand:+ start:14107 stop:14547 length:441 start_codon:yes stop_codon:yes gene_type:complete
MEVIQSLGLNYTIFYQFGIFLVAYLFLAKFLFEPYLAVHRKREQNTVGKESLAEEIDMKTQDLHIQFDRLQKDLNNKIQEKFRHAKQAGEKEAKQIMDQARAESENFLAQTNQKISQEVGQAQERFRNETPHISKSIVEKLVGRSF